MPYAAPLIKPTLSPLRPPSPLPYRPPGSNRLPPTQTAPIYQPPDLLPPTGLDLKGTICIYSNAPVWELKKIRYRYPGEAWKEIAGEEYSLLEEENDWTELPLVIYQVFCRANSWCFDSPGEQILGWFLVSGGFTMLPVSFDAFLYTPEGDRINIAGNAFRANDQNGNRPNGNFAGSDHTGMWAEYPPYSGCAGEKICTIGIWNSNPKSQYCEKAPNEFYEFRVFGAQPISAGSFQITRVVRLSDGQEIPPRNECTFKVFNIFNQEILSITRETCPEVIVVPERCYFKAENERLVRKINISFFQTLKTEYSGNCVTVLLESYPFPIPIEVFKECSDNPNCPPPRIRFDQKCEEKCEQCPPGTTVKVLLGNRIACVNAFGCVKKMIKYKPGCNVYDCICG